MFQKGRLKITVSKVFKVCSTALFICESRVDGILGAGIVWIFLADLKVLEVKTLRARCTNIVQLWTRVKSEFEPSSAVNCIAPKRLKCWSPFNSELPSDHRSNFDLGSTRGYACPLGRDTIAAKKLSNLNFILSKKLPRIELRLLTQLCWWSGYVIFVLCSLCAR